MSLGSVLHVASSSLAAIDREFAVIGQNVANANTRDWTAETADPVSLTADGVGMGVRMQPTQRSIDTALQTAAFSQATVAAGLDTTSKALSTIDSAQGSVGSGNDIASLVGSLQTAFSTLQTDPSSQTQQQAIVDAASNLAAGINTLANAVAATRQAAQDAAVAEVANANGLLQTVGDLNKQIVALTSQGQSVADLENQRDAAIDSLSQIIPVKIVPQSNGATLLATPSGVMLPTDQPDPLSLAQATLGPEATYPASDAVPGLLINGVDVTASLSGAQSGQLGANLSLRDTTMPQYQAALDEFAGTLATRFDAQGLTLFTDSTGAVPSVTANDTQVGFVGFSSEITVNPAVASNPSLVRDGTHSVEGSATGASSFTPNPAGGPVGFAGLISRVLTNTFGSDVQDGVSQPTVPATGLGPAGNQALSFAPPSDLPGFATALASALAQDGSAASAQSATADATRTTLQAKLTQQGGVSVDDEMSLMLQLQNTYGATARIVNGVQTMWNALLGMMQ